MVAAILAWWAVAHLRAGSSEAHELSAPAAVQQAQGRAAAPGLAEAMARARSRARVPFAASFDTGGDVQVVGRVIDLYDATPIPGVEVVFRSAAGEATALSDADGNYAIRVAAGMYHAFVRDDSVLSVGRTAPIRVPGAPTVEAAGVPDEAMMAIVLATHDTDGVDLPVVRGGVVTGRVIDRAGHAIAGAVVRAQTAGLRPALGTDVSETGRDGSFELRLPVGTFMLDASHPRFAGLASAVGLAPAEAGAADAASSSQLVVQPGARLSTTLTLAAGCIVTGRVLRFDGSAAGEGAIERQWGSTATQYTPDGRIEADGTFRWTTLEQADMQIRAWPWKSPPSPSQRFSCRDGARFDHVVLRLPDQAPVMSGVLVDAAGAPVGLTYVDVRPLDADGLAQQERTDEAGNWEVYSLPPGHYFVFATTERGVVSQSLVSPQRGVRLVLGGTGRIEGTAGPARTGSFELALGTCTDDGARLPLPEAQRLVSITDGAFTIDNLPACALTFSVAWHGHKLQQQVTIPRGGTAALALDFDALARAPEEPDPLDANASGDEGTENGGDEEPFVPDVEDREPEGDDPEPTAPTVPTVPSVGEQLPPARPFVDGRPRAVPDDDVDGR